ncbi:hypothetical protein JOB18_001233 [Solea senegalensis]|uniref:Uncharacterized protein n=1 Tax=Solea senegalensis TaxID=28829 RepID=A0AAV6SES7_SOLSE|nr:hypothetical protein JOB18_001233 [Solea senegalensis]
MYNPACFIILSWVFALLVFPGVPARSGDSVLKDNITVRQGDSAVLNTCFFFRDWVERCQSMHRCSVCDKCVDCRCLKVHLQAAVEECSRVYFT